MRGRVRRVVGACLLPLVATASMASSSTATDARDDRTPQPPGRLIDIGGYRLHAIIRGHAARGTPTVIFLNGSGDFSFVWTLVQPAVSHFARTVAYDRAGDAWSDLGPTPRSMHQESFELHLLLERARITPPYVLVGHSYGGLLARVFVERYGADVVGVVLVDATHESTVLGINNKNVRLRELAKAVPVPGPQTLASSPPKPPTAEDVKQFEDMQEMFGPPKIEPPFDRLPASAQRYQLWASANPKLSAGADNYFAEEMQAMYVARQTAPHSLGDRPLVAIAAGGRSGPPPGVAADEWEKIIDEKRQQKADLATLSTDGVLVVDETSGHHIHLENPQLVIDSIRRVVDAVRAHRRLTPR